MDTDCRRKIQVKANALRNRMTVNEYGIEDIFRNCEKLNFNLIRYPVGEDSVLGFACIRDGIKIIFSNSSSILSREIFSISHELGHMELHISDLQPVMEDMSFSGSDTNEEENEANYFAACLLMPDDLVRKYVQIELNKTKSTTWTPIDIARLMSTFSVSCEMALNRLAALKLISNTVRSNLLDSSHQRGITALLSTINGATELCKQSCVKSVPAEFLTWVFDNYNNGIISLDLIKKALGYLDMDLHDVSVYLHPKADSADTSDDDLDTLIGGIKE